MEELAAHIATLKAHPELGPLLAPLFDLLEFQAARIVELEAEVADLKARLEQTSSNSL